MYQMLTEVEPPKTGAYLVHGIVRMNGRPWYRVLDWNFKPKYNPQVNGFSVGGVTLNAIVKITHWAEIPVFRSYKSSTVKRDLGLDDPDQPVFPLEKEQER